MTELGDVGIGLQLDLNGLEEQLQQLEQYTAKPIKVKLQLDKDAKEAIQREIKALKIEPVKVDIVINDKELERQLKRLQKVKNELGNYEIKIDTSKSEANLARLGSAVNEVRSQIRGLDRDIRRLEDVSINVNTRFSDRQIKSALKELENPEVTVDAKFRRKQVQKELDQLDNLTVLAKVVPIVDEKRALQQLKQLEEPIRPIIAPRLQTRNLERQVEESVARGTKVGFETGLNKVKIKFFNPDDYTKVELSKSPKFIRNDYRPDALFSKVEVSKTPKLVLNTDSPLVRDTLTRGFQGLLQAITNADEHNQSVTRSSGGQKGSSGPLSTPIALASKAASIAINPEKQVYQGFMSGIGQNLAAPLTKNLIKTLNKELGTDLTALGTALGKRLISKGAGLSKSLGITQTREDFSLFAKEIIEFYKDVAGDISLLDGAKRRYHENYKSTAERVKANAITRSQEIQKTDKEAVTIVSGGFAGKKGEHAKENVIPLFQKHNLLENHELVDFKNTNSDTNAGLFSAPQKWLPEVLVNKLLRNVVRGSNPDAERMATEALAHQMANPGKPVNLFGTSGGGLNVSDALEILKATGSQGFRGVSEGTPISGLINNNKRDEFTNFMGMLDPAVLLTLTPQGRENNRYLTTGGAGHYTPNYFKDKNFRDETTEFYSRSKPPKVPLGFRIDNLGKESQGVQVGINDLKARQEKLIRELEIANAELDQSFQQLEQSSKETSAKATKRARKSLEVRQRRDQYLANRQGLSANPPPESTQVVQGQSQLSDVKVSSVVGTQNPSKEQFQEVIARRKELFKTQLKAVEGLNGAEKAEALRRILQVAQQEEERVNTDVAQKFGRNISGVLASYRRFLSSSGNKPGVQQNITQQLNQLSPEAGIRGGRQRAEGRLSSQTQQQLDRFSQSFNLGGTQPPNSTIPDGPDQLSKVAVPTGVSGLFGKLKAFVASEKGSNLISTVGITASKVAGARLGSELGIVGELVGGLGTGLVARNAIALGRSGASAYTGLKGDKDFQSAGFREKFKRVAQQTGVNFNSEANQKDLGSGVSGDLIGAGVGAAVGKGLSPLLGRIASELDQSGVLKLIESIPGKGAIAAAVATPGLVKLRERIATATTKPSKDLEQSSEVDVKQLSKVEQNPLQAFADRFKALFSKQRLDAQKTYEAIIRETAKLSGINIKPGDIPKLVVSNSKLDGSKALYDIKSNQIIISKATGELLGSTIENIQRHQKKIADVVHEARHALQLNFGKTSIGEIAGGIKQPNVPLFDPNKPHSEYVAKGADLSVQASVNSAAAKGYTVPQIGLETLKRLELDAYQFEEQFTGKIVDSVAQALKSVGEEFNPDVLYKREKSESQRKLQQAVFKGGQKTPNPEVKTSVVEVLPPEALKLPEARPKTDTTQTIDVGQTQAAPKSANQRRLREVFFAKGEDREALISEAIGFRAGKVNRARYEAVRAVSPEFGEQFADDISRRKARKIAGDQARQEVKETVKSGVKEATNNFSQRISGNVPPTEAGKSLPFRPSIGNAKAAFQGLFEDLDTLKGKLNIEGVLSGFSKNFDKTFASIRKGFDVGTGGDLGVVYRLQNYARGIQGAFNFGRKIDQPFDKLKEAGDRVFPNLGTKALQLGKAFLGIAGVAIIASEVIKLGKASFGAFVELDKLKTALNFAVGGQSQGASALKFVGETVDQLKIPLAGSVKGFTQLAAATRGTTAEGKGTRDVFLGLSQASTVLSLSADETQGALLALSQSASKGVVSSEELRQQLSERIPGAMGIAARSMGLTESAFNSLLESGQILSSDFLPRFGKQLQAEFGDAAKSAAGNAQSAIFNLQNAFTKLQQGFGEGISPAAIGILNIFAVVVEVVANNIQHLVLALTAIGLTLTQMFISSLVASIGWMGIAKAVVGSLSTVLGALTTVVQRFGKELAIAGLSFVIIEMIKAVADAVNNDLSQSFKKAAEEARKTAEAAKDIKPPPNGKDGNGNGQGNEPEKPKTTAEVQGRGGQKGLPSNGVIDDVSRDKEKGGINGIFDIATLGIGKIGEQINRGVTYLKTGSADYYSYADLRRDDVIKGVADMTGYNSEFSGDARSRLAELKMGTGRGAQFKKIDKDLQNAQDEQKALKSEADQKYTRKGLAVDPDLQFKIQQNQDKIKTLNQQRQDAAEPFQQNLAGIEKLINNTKGKIEELKDPEVVKAVGGQAVADERRGALQESLNNLNKLKVEYQSTMSALRTDPVLALGNAFEQLTKQLDDAKRSTERYLATQKEKNIRGEIAGFATDPNAGRKAALANLQAERNGAEDELNSTNKGIADLKPVVESQATSAALAGFGLSQDSTIGDIDKELGRTGQTDADKPKRQVLEQFKKYKELQDKVPQLNLNVAEKEKAIQEQVQTNTLADLDRDTANRESRVKRTESSQTAAVRARQLKTGESDTQVGDQLARIQLNATKDYQKSLNTQLQSLEDAHQKGIISAEEYEKRRRDIEDRLGDLGVKKAEQELAVRKAVSAKILENLQIAADKAQLEAKKIQNTAVISIKRNIIKKGLDANDSEAGVDLAKADLDATNRQEGLIGNQLAELTANKDKIDPEEFRKKSMELEGQLSDLGVQKADKELALRDAINRKIIEGLELANQQATAAVQLSETERVTANKATLATSDPDVGKYSEAAVERSNVLIEADSTSQRIALKQREIEQNRKLVADKNRSAKEGQKIELQLQQEVAELNQKRVDQEIRLQKELRDKRIQLLEDVEKYELKSLQRSKDLVQAQQGLAKALNDLANAGDKGRADQFGRAAELIKKRDDENSGPETQEAARNQLKRLGVDENATELDVLAKKAEIENRIAERKMAAQELEFDYQKKILELEIQRDKLAAKQEIRKAKKDVRDAEKADRQAKSDLLEAYKSGDPEKIRDAELAAESAGIDVKDAKLNLKDAQENSDAVDKTADYKRQTLAATQDTQRQDTYYQEENRAETQDMTLAELRDKYGDDGKSRGIADRGYRQVDAYGQRLTDIYNTQNKNEFANLEMKPNSQFAYAPAGPTAGTFDQAGAAQQPASVSSALGEGFTYMGQKFDELSQKIEAAINRPTSVAFHSQKPVDDYADYQNRQAGNTLRAW